jgi:hypothetical protein
MKVICSECRLGRLEPVLMPYMYVLEGRPLVAPGVAAMLCDFCGQVDYDPDFICSLQSLIDVHKFGDDQRHTTRRQMLVASKRVWQRVRRSV